MVQTVFVTGESTENGLNCCTCRANRMTDGLALALSKANPSKLPPPIRLPFCSALNQLVNEPCPKWPAWLSLTGPGDRTSSSRVLYPDGSWLKILANLPVSSCATGWGCSGY